MTLNFDKFKTAFLHSLDNNGLNEQKIQQIHDHFTILSLFMSNSEEITYFFIQINEDIEKSDLYLWSTNFQIKIFNFSDTEKPKYSICRLTNSVKNLMMDYENLSRIPKINVQYNLLDSTENFSLSGRRANREPLEQIIRDYLIPNICMWPDA